MSRRPVHSSVGQELLATHTERAPHSTMTQPSYNSTENLNTHHAILLASMH